MRTCRHSLAGGRAFAPESVVEGGLGAQALGAPQPRLVLQPALARGARGFGRLARFGDSERAADEVGEPLLSLAAVVFLGAVVARDDEDRAIRREPPPAQSLEARLDTFGEH